MSASDDRNAPNPSAGWFSRLSRHMQALLLAIMMLGVSAVTSLLGMHGLHAGERVTVMASRSDWSDDFFWSAVTFVLGACLLAVAVGWRPEGFRLNSGNT